MTDAQLGKVAKYFCRRMKLDERGFIPLGSHGDGVPIGKSSTMEVMSWNFVAIPQGERNLFTAIPKSSLCDCKCRGRHSLDECMRVFVWSLRCLVMGVFPRERHDGRAWRAEDGWRRSMAERNATFGFTAGLVQVRGDCAFHTHFFDFPSWSADSICWRCQANRSSRPFWDFSARAAWRAHRYKSKHFLRWCGCLMTI